MQVGVQWEPDESGKAVEIPWENRAKGTRFLDLRDEPAALVEIEPARRQRPLHNFLAALNSADSVFSTVRAQVWLEPESEAGEAQSIFASGVDLVFASEEMNFDRVTYEGLVQRLFELLTRDPGDALAVQLSVRRCEFRNAGRRGHALGIRLSARGETPGQAELRWGLGIARVQQALLYISRVIRQHLAQAN